MRTTYKDQSLLALTASYQTVYFNAAADLLILKNDEASGTNYIEYSFNGADKAGELRPTESLVMDKLNGYGSISLKYAGGAPAYRLTVIGK